MTQASLNNIGCTSLRLSLPRFGAWYCDADISTDDVLGVTSAGGQPVPTVGSPCLVAVDDFSFLGSVVVCDTSVYGKARVRVLAGMGKLGTTARSKSYGAGPTVSLVLADMLPFNGELPANAAASKPQFINAFLQSWQTFGDRTLGQNLTRMCNGLGCVWRVDPKTASVYLTQDTFTVATAIPSDAVVSSNSYAGQNVLEVPALDALPLPGTVTADGMLVQEVVLRLADSRLTVTLNPIQTSSLLNKPTDQELYGCYSATVVSQAPDGTMSLIADDDRINGTGLQFVRTLPGVGLTQTAAPGTRVVLSFTNGDVTRPVVTGFDGTPPLTMTLNAVTSVNVGPAPVPLAQAAPVAAMLAALKAFAASSATATTAAQIATAAGVLSTALGSVPPVPTTLLKGT